MLKIEHFAYQVANPPAVAAWYCDHLDFTIKRAGQDEAKTHFLADGAGNVMLEFYCNPAIEVPDYPSMHPLTLHLAFSCDDVEGTLEALQAAGATMESAMQVTEKGDTLAMLRDPWGMVIQFCKRATSML